MSDQFCEICGTRIEQSYDCPAYCPKCVFNPPDRGILEVSFNLCSDQGEIVVEGYGGEYDPDVIINGPGGYATYTLTKAEVEELHKYLTAWLNWDRTRYDPATGVKVGS